MENWKDIDECPTYEVSDKGNVRFKKTGKVLKPDWTNKGYAKVALWNGEKYLKRYIHRLVAIAFIPNPDGLAQVNHKNEDKSCNELWNLEWCSQEYNNRYSFQGKHRPTRPILQYTLDGEFVKEFRAYTDAAASVGVDHSHIASCADGYYSQSGGYVWKWK